MKYFSELARKSIHFSSLAIPVGMFLLPLRISQPLLLGLALFTLSLDVIRLHVKQARQVFYFVFGRILREHERFNLLGGTYLFLSALISIFAFQRTVAAVSVAYLVVGDTMAALIGRRWGRVRILDKSLEGSLACLASCLLLGWLVPGHELGAARIIVGSVVATLFELLPIPLDDNMRIPLAAGFAMTLLRS